MDNPPKDKASNTEDMESDNHPSPMDFDVYLPYACSQLQVEAVIVVTKVVQQEYVSISAMSEKSKSKQKGKQPKMPSHQDLDSDQERDEKSVSPSVEDEENVINILAVYDANDNLVQLKFDKNKNIPRTVLRIIGLIIQYQIYLTTLCINKGMDQYTIYEICRFLPLSHLTDICLDSCFLKEANYHMLLEKQNCIRQLSLARCSISDEVVQTLAELLVYPLPASKSLSILNLSSNRLTDLGAKYLSEALRSNRQLSYLNLADNMISDAGADEVLNTLVNFPLSFNELLSSRSRHMAYLKEKSELVIRIARELRAGDFDRRLMKRKSVKPPPLTKKPKGVEKEPSLKSVVESKSTTNMDAAFLDKATIMAENTLGEFKDPFNKANTFVQDGIVYSYGNNALSYLNLSYNNLSYTSVKKLAKVLAYQKKVDKKPRGLVNVSIEGNFLPVYCRELAHIDQILDVGLSSHQRRVSSHKKRPQSKPSAK
ncbi:NACHT, LRR and PYD domains-containing protein 14-like [Ostrinia nubilalis]|uniref:NACHT, LRR and PYD domains-containing protein 14-like n=1 Tax=Ostrinia nubilalis TaxID=29057 RepID=UPI00308260FB